MPNIVNVRTVLSALLTLLVLWPPAVAQAGGGWSTPVNISASLVDTEQGSIIVDAAGRTHVVWSEAGDLWHRYKTDEGWSASTRLGSGISPDLATVGAGTVYLVYSNRFEDNDEIYLIAWQQETGWGLPVNVSQTTGESLLPAVAVVSQTLAVVWSEASGDTRVIYLAQSDDGLLWSSGPVPHAQGIYPVVAGASDGIWVAWQDVYDVGFPMEVFASRRTASGWSLPVDVSASPQTNSQRPSLAEHQGDAYLAWEENRLDGDVILLARMVGGHWMEPVQRSGEEAAHVPVLVVDGGGQGHLAWTATFAVQYVRGNLATDMWNAVSNVALDLVQPIGVDLAAGETAQVIWLSEVAPDNRDVWYREAVPLEQPYACYVPLVWR